MHHCIDGRKCINKVLFASKNILGSTLQGVGTYNLSHQSDYKIHDLRKTINKTSIQKSLS